MNKEVFLMLCITIPFALAFKILMDRINYRKKYNCNVTKKFLNADEYVEFNSIYEEIMNENLTELKKQRLKKKMKSIVFSVYMIFAFIGFFLMLLYVKNIVLTIVVGVILMIVGGALFPTPLKIKNNIVEMLLKNIDQNIKYSDLNDKMEEQKVIIKDLYEGSGFRDRASKIVIDPFYNGPTVNKKEASDYIEYVTKDDIIVKLSDISLKYETRRNSRSYTEEIFKGIIAKIENREMVKNNFLIEINKINKKLEYSYKYQEADEPFEKVFDIRVTDVNDAVVVMNETAKKELLNLYYKYGIMFEIALKEKNIYIRFYVGDLFEIDGKSMKKIKKDLCANYYMFKDIMVLIDEINTILSQDNVISIRQGY